MIYSWTTSGSCSFTFRRSSGSLPTFRCVPWSTCFDACARERLGVAVTHCRGAIFFPALKGLRGVDRCATVSVAVSEDALHDFLGFFRCCSKKTAGFCLTSSATLGRASFLTSPTIGGPNLLSYRHRWAIYAVCVIGCIGCTRAGYASILSSARVWTLGRRWTRRCPTRSGRRGET